MTRPQENRNESSTVEKFIYGLQVAHNVLNLAVQVAGLFGGSAQPTNQQQNRQNNRPAGNQNSANAGKRTNYNANQNRKPANNSNRNQNAPRSNAANGGRPKAN